MQIGMSRRPGSSYIATSIECILKHSHRSWASPRGSPLPTASSTAAPHSPALKLSSIFRDVDDSMWLDVSWNSEEEVVARLNKMVAKYKLHGKDDLDPADLPVNLQYAASHIKFHKVGYRPLALNAHSPMAPLCKMISIVCIEI